MIRIGLAGTWHVYFGGYANAARRDPRCRITALWDPDPVRGKQAAAGQSCDFEPTPEALCAREDVDAVLVCCETNLHEAAITAAANAGKHVFTEKVLCIEPEAAERTAEAVRRSGISFCISFPWRCRSDFLWIKEALDGGLVGRPTFCRMRNTHNGAIAGWLPESFFDPEICGGGAMMDLGAHGMYLLNWLLGEPVKAASAFTSVTGKAVEDNALTALVFENGAIGVNETGFVSNCDPFAFELTGEKGTILAGGFLDRVCYNTGEGWRFPNLPKAMPDPLTAWLDSIENGTPSPFGIDDAVALTKTMALAYRNA